MLITLRRLPNNTSQMQILTAPRPRHSDHQTRMFNSKITSLPPSQFASTSPIPPLYARPSHPWSNSTQLSSSPPNELLITPRVYPWTTRPSRNGPPTSQPWRCPLLVATTRMPREPNSISWSKSIAVRTTDARAGSATWSTSWQTLTITEWLLRRSTGQLHRLLDMLHRQSITLGSHLCRPTW